MKHHLASCGSVVAVIMVAHLGSLSGAGSSISGKVRVTGLASNANVVVYIQQAPGVFKPPAKPVTMDQEKMQFIPPVLPVVLGTTVRFLNSDPTLHDVFSPDNERYNLPGWPQGQTKDYAFSECMNFPCVYTQLCRLHPEMEAYIVVLQNPFFGVSKADGRYQIDDVPPGHYVVGMWHPKLIAQSRGVTIEVGKPVVVDF